MQDLILNAAAFARDAHQGQVRRITGKPYITHPARVASRVAILEGRYENHCQLVAAAFLHDVVEDTSVQLRTIKDNFGAEVARVVEGLTEQYTKVAYPKLSRRERKKFEFQKISKLPTDIKIIKLLDRIDNLGEMVIDDSFLPVYLTESKNLLAALDGAVEEIYQKDFKLLIDELKTMIEHWELLMKTPLQSLESK